MWRLTRWLVLPITLIALLLTLVFPSLIVSILLVAYDFISQFFPAVVIGGLFWRRATKQGAFCGIVAGWVVSGYLVLTKQDPFHGWNAGLIGLMANLIVFFVVSLMTKPVSSARYFTEGGSDVASAKTT